MSGDIHSLILEACCLLAWQEKNRKGRRPLAVYLWF